MGAFSACLLLSATLCGCDKGALPKVDVHGHFDPDATPQVVDLMDRHGIGVAINLSGGWRGQGLEQSVQVRDQTQRRIVFFCNIDWQRVLLPGWIDSSIQALEDCKRQGGLGLKIAKFLGLSLRDPADGRLIAVDDPRLDPIFDAAGRLGLPVAIHSGDPKAFFERPTLQNERWAELSVHPRWSFYGGDYPSWTGILDQLERRVAQSGRTKFIGVHFGNAAEDPARVGRMLDRHPNLYIDTAARAPEFGRHDASRMRRFFERYQDRVLFGTDLQIFYNRIGGIEVVLGSSGDSPPAPADFERFFGGQWRYFETREANIPSPTPIQGTWNIHGVGLSRAVLRKIYHHNAERLLGIRLPAPAR